MSCTSDYQACLKKCRPATGYDKFLCKLSCTQEFLECLLPSFSFGILELLNFISVLEALQAEVEEQILVARSQADVKLSELKVAKAGGVQEHFMPNVVLRQRLTIAGISATDTNDVVRHVAEQFQDGQTTQDIRTLASTKLAEKDPELVTAFIEKA